jgi:hypothetical protein
MSSVERGVSIKHLRLVHAAKVIAPAQVPMPHSPIQLPPEAARLAAE